MPVLNADFKIINKVQEFGNLIDNAICNIPNSDKYYKDLIRNKIIELIENICFLNNSDNDKNVIKLYSNKIKTNLDIIDYLLERFYIKKYISHSTIDKLATKLKEINYMKSGFINYKEGLCK